MIKGIFFDYDGTLSNRAKSAYLKVRKDIKEIFKDLDEDSYELEGIVQRMVTWDEFGSINKSHMYEKLNNAYNLNLDIDYWVESWNEVERFQVLQEGCLEVLEKLKDKYKLGILSNGEERTQMPKIKYTGVDKIMDVVMVTGTYGIHKPNKEIFMIGAEKMGLDPSEIAFIGDTFYNDIYGSKNAGMHPVWICSDPDRQMALKDVKRIYTFKELLEIF